MHRGNGLRGSIADTIGRLAGTAALAVMRAFTQPLPPRARGHARHAAFSEAIRNSVSTIDLNGTTIKMLGWSEGIAVAYNELQTLDWIDKYFHENDVFFDIGANHGLYSIYCAKRHSSSKVICFEPNLITAGALTQNILLNDLASRIIVLPIAATNRSPCLDRFTISSLWPAMPGAALDVSRIVLSEIQSRSQSFTVLASDIASLCTLLDLPRPTVIRLDVDGHEPAILSSTESWLACAREILVEVHPSIMDLKEGPGHDILRNLRSRGFREEKAPLSDHQGFMRRFCRHPTEEGEAS